MDEAAARGVIISPLGRSARSSPPPPDVTPLPTVAQDAADAIA